MRSIVFVGLAVLAGCVSGPLSPEVLDLAQGTKPAGAFHIEFGPDGMLQSAGGEVDLATVPEAVRAGADQAFPGGRQVGAEKVIAGGQHLWLVAKEIDGQGFELLVRPDGTVVGGEEVLAEARWPKAAVAAAQAAVPGATLERVERVWGPEAIGGEAFHVKFRKDGDSLRVGVDEAGKVVRVVRRVPGQFRVER